MRRPLTALAVAAALAPSLAACGSGGGGGGGGQGSSPEETVATFVRAIADGNGAAACEQLTARGQNNFAAGGNCSGQIVTVIAPTGKEAAAFANATFKLDRESNRKATVTATLGNGDKQKFRLALEDGEWKIRA